MTIKTTATAVLTRVINVLDEPSSFLLDGFFPTIQTEPGSEEIHFDLDKERPRLTPFVHPTVEGIVVEDEGYDTKSFRPAYAKDKRRLRPQEVMRRSLGEPIAGTLSPSQRRDRAIARSLVNQRRNLARREEVMAAEAMRLGEVTVSGEKYPTVVVSFQRHESLTIVLTGASRWSDPNVDPLSDIEDWAGEIQALSGAVAKEVIMAPDVWKVFRAKQSVKDLLDTRRGSEATMELGPQSRGQGNAKARLAGFVGDFRIWVYQETYVDDAGATQSLMPAGQVILAAMGEPGDGDGGLEGARCYGAILDEEAGFEAERLFAKTWLEKDPAVRWILAQAAPLPVPYRANAGLGATVL